MRSATRPWLFGMLCCLGVWLGGCAPPKPTQDWTAEQLYDYGQRRMAAKDWLQAQEAFRMLTLNHSGSDLVDEALYYLGETHQKMEEFPVAVVTYRRLLRDFPQSPYADEAQYQLANAIYQQSSPVQLTQDKTFEAIRELQIFLDEYPDSDMALKAHELLQRCYDKIAEKDYNIGHLYFKMSDWESARLYFSEMIEEFPMSRWAAPARYEIAESYAREKKWEDAIRQYTLFIESYPGHELIPKAKERLEELKTLYAEKESGDREHPDLKNTPGQSPALTKSSSGSSGDRNR